MSEQNPKLQQVLDGHLDYDDLTESERNEMYYLLFPGKREESEAAYQQFRDYSKEYKHVIRLYCIAIGGCFLPLFHFWGFYKAMSIRAIGNPLIQNKTYPVVVLMIFSLVFQFFLFMFFMLNAYANWHNGTVGSATYVYIFAVDFIFASLTFICMIASTLIFNTFERKRYLKSINVKEKSKMNVKYYTDKAFDAAAYKIKQQLKKRKNQNVQNNEI
jgi:cation transport ATPase